MKLTATLTIGSTGKASGKLCFANAVWTLTGTKYSKLDREARTATLSLTAIDETAVTGKLYLYFAPNTKKNFKGAVRVVEFQSW